jgi:hypothetical protein
MEVSDKIINNFFGKINAFLSLYNICFVGGAFIFEDNDAILYNLLTYNKLDVDDNLCDSSIFPSKSVSFKQSKTHGVFLSKFNPVMCMPQIKISIPGCKESRCIKFEREINLNHICDVCKPDNQRVRNDDQTKRVILYYPFVDTATNKRYLYIKLESHKMISRGHLLEASKTYILKTKTPERRENDHYTNKLKESDSNFYNNLSNYFGINNSSLNEYNSSVRNGAEFFISRDLLDLFIDFFLNEDSISSVCNNPALKPSVIEYKNTSLQTASRKSASYKSPSRKSASHKSPSRKSASRKSASRKSASRKSASRKSASHKSPSYKSPTRKSPSRKIQNRKSLKSYMSHTSASSNSFSRKNNTSKSMGFVSKPINSKSLKDDSTIM